MNTKICLFVICVLIVVPTICMAGPILGFKIDGRGEGGIISSCTMYEIRAGDNTFDNIFPDVTVTADNSITDHFYPTTGSVDSVNSFISYLNKNSSGEVLLEFECPDPYNSGVEIDFDAKSTFSGLQDVKINSISLQVTNFHLVQDPHVPCTDFYGNFDILLDVPEPSSLLLVIGFTGMVLPTIRRKK